MQIEVKEKKEEKDWFGNQSNCLLCLIVSGCCSNVTELKMINLGKISSVL